MYRAEFTPTAMSDLKRLNKPVAQRILTKIHWLVDNFESLSHQALTGQWQDFYKLRVGDYRVLYTFDPNDQALMVHFVRHRSEVYKTR